MKRNTHASPVAIAVCWLATFSPLNAQVGDNAVVQWSSVALQAVRDTHPGPPQVARALAMLDT